MKKILVIFGTRPEAIKMSPLVKELQKRQDICCKVCVTAQHRQMLDQVLTIFGIIPDYDLDIMKARQTLSQITTAALLGLEEILLQEKVDLILVHGDTTTTFVGALAAFYHQIPVGHVEAGLRTWNKYSPFPEEMNRQMVDRIATLFFAPTEESRKNLLLENIDDSMICVTGNTAIDALAMTVQKNYTHPQLEWAKGSRLILLTAHRRENLGDAMKHIFHAVRRITEEFEDVKVIYPIHLNPVIRETAEEIFAGSERVRLIEPLDVIDFHNFLSHAYLVMTDSGGIQEEAPSLGKPVLVLRDTTERPEGVAAGTLKLVGTKEEDIYQDTAKLLRDPDTYLKMSEAANPYGDGKASIRIADAVESYFESGKPHFQ
ncbi:MAG: UDP-N-acetylglucosamine 2-epimerase (non-hydrolyzing) [Butyrivibrio sp.]|nr:UDP-N-acetylglucosamine 2-epimerase (non-hydrolyzing) [Butyrivibrio sp.]